jgi:hypothetical protein
MSPKNEKWLAFRVEDGFHKEVKMAADKRGTSVKDLCVEALQDAMAPRHHSVELAERPKSDDVCEDLQSFAQDARQELIFVGTTLNSICCDAGDKLSLDKFKDAVRLTFMLLFPPLLPKDYRARETVLNAVASRIGITDLALLKEIHDTLARLADLREKANREGIRFEEGSIQIFGLEAPPTMGLVIVDPNVPGSKMRLSIYAPGFPRQFDPTVTLVYSGAGDEIMVYGALYKSYLHLRESAQPPLTPEQAVEQMAEFESSYTAQKQKQAAATVPALR